MRALLLLALLLSACASSLRTPCQQTCYDHRSNEPSDFDDCIKRCNK